MNPYEMDVTIFENTKVNNVTGWFNKIMKWSDFIDKLSKVQINDYTLDEYKNNKEKLSHLKDVGCVVCGELEGDRRKEEFIKYRSIIALDIDDCDITVWEKISKIKYEHFWHTSHSHTPSKPRIRVFIPLSKKICNKEQYNIITQELSRYIGFIQINEKKWSEIDSCSFKYNQVMFYPSMPKDSEFKYKHVSGELLNPFEYLKERKDLNRIMKNVAKKTLKKMGKQDNVDIYLKINNLKSLSEYKKDDVIYKFCNIYNIHETIKTYLDDIYKPGIQEGTYTYINGSSINGLKVYPDKMARPDVFAYSFHNTDPLNDDHCHNSFDMLKIHKFNGDIKETLKFVKKELGINEEFAIQTDAGHEAYYHYFEEEKLKLDYDELVKHIQDDKEHRTFNTPNGFYSYEEGNYERYSKNNVKQQLIEKHVAKQFKSNRDVTEIYERLCRNEKRVDVLNDFNNLLIFKNCILEFDRKGNYEIKEHSPEYLNTYKFNVTYHEGTKCLVWEKFLNDILPKDQQKVLQEIIGYTLLPDNSAKKFFALYGVGDSGKSVILKVIQRILGSDLTSSITLQKLSSANSTFDSSSLYGKLANIVGDLSSAPLHDSSLIKMLTGDDKISAQEKYGRPFDFYNKARLICSMNNLPKICDRNNAFYDRFLIIPFETAIPVEKQDRDLINKFDFQSIVSWAIEGLQRLLRNNLIFSTTSVNDEVLGKYKKDNNNVIQFVDEAFEDLSGIDTTVSDIFNCYKIFCKDNGYSPLGRNKFVNELKAFRPDIEYSTHCKSKDGKEFRGFKNVKIKDQMKSEYLHLVQPFN